MELSKSKTLTNLARAFAGECQARTRYEFIEYGARNEGYAAIADLIDSVVYNEFNHARMFYTCIQQASKSEIKNIDVCCGFPFKEKWDLTENLRLAAEDERFEAEEIYPIFAKTARDEGFEDIAGLFENVISVEKKHQKLFSELHKQMKEGTLYKKGKPTLWKCPSCGYEATLPEAWDKCPLCQAEQGVVKPILPADAQL